jgi:hypothetical protein
LLVNGMLLIAGGAELVNVTPDLYDPAAGTFAATGDMTTAREFHTATLLSSGMVLIAGGNGLVLTASGQDDSGNLASAELYE